MGTFTINLFQCRFKYPCPELSETTASKVKGISKSIDQIYLKYVNDYLSNLK